MEILIEKNSALEVCSGRMFETEKNIVATPRLAGWQASPIAVDNITSL
jgi:hypothetical protein